MDITLIRNKRNCSGWYGVLPRITPPAQGVHLPGCQESVTCWGIMCEFLCQREATSSTNDRCQPIPLLQCGTSLKGCPCSRASHGTGRGFWCNCILVQTLPLPTLFQIIPLEMLLPTGLPSKLSLCTSLGFRVSWWMQGKRVGTRNSVSITRWKASS